MKIGLKIIRLNKKEQIKELYKFLYQNQNFKDNDGNKCAKHKQVDLAKRFKVSPQIIRRRLETLVFYDLIEKRNGNIYICDLSGKEFYKTIGTNGRILYYGISQSKADFYKTYYKRKRVEQSV